jgi:hypothetical protein
VINADVKDSRKLKFNKKDIEPKLMELNKELGAELLIGFKILLGDECQALLKRDARVFKVIRYLKAAFHPYELRIGVGFGSIEETDLSQIEHSFQLSGDAFYEARDAVDELKRKNSKKDLNYGVKFKTGMDGLNHQLNVLYHYIHRELEGFKEDVYVMTSLEEKGYTHEQIARELYSDEVDVDELVKKSKRVSVTKKLLRVHWYQIKETETILQELLMRGIFDV